MLVHDFRLSPSWVRNKPESQKILGHVVSQIPAAEISAVTEAPPKHKEWNHHANVHGPKVNSNLGNA